MILSSVTRRLGRRGVAVAVAAVVLLGVGGGVAVAATTGHSGTSVTRVAVTTQDTAVVYTGAAWVNVGSTAVFATAGQFIDARFTAETACTGTGGWCSVRVLVDGVEAEPVVGTDFAFDDAGSATGWESHSVERVRSVVTTGTHSVIVQAAQIGGTTDRLDDWTLAAYAVAM